MKESPRLAFDSDPSSLFIEAKELKHLVTRNIETLLKLYDQERKVFGYRVYVDSYPRLLKRCTRNPLSMHVLSLGEYRAAYTGNEVKIDFRVDLKYVGHAVVGLAKYCSLNRDGCDDLIDMVCNNLEYLMKYQTKSGALRCRYVSPSSVESGSDRRSVAEATESFLWAIGAMCKLSENNSRQLEELVQRAVRAGRWLIENKQFLLPQELGRTIYGLSLVRDAEPTKDFFLWIKALADDLIRRLGTSRSFGLFPNDIDAIGGLSIAYLDTKCTIFMSAMDRLVHSLLGNQGAKGEWRWFLSSRGNCRRIFDVTYTVHQLGMASWGLALYFPTGGMYNQDLALGVVKGIRWVLEKQPFSERFIVRSFSGLTGRPVELEQRAYEAGLNLLGLLSYCATEAPST